MLKLSHRIDAFLRLGHYLHSFSSKNISIDAPEPEKNCLQNLEETVQNSPAFNGWFTEANVRQMLVALGESLEKYKLEKWLKNYSPVIEENKEEKTVAVVMAGNIPAVGFHDFLSVLISGNKLLAKLSSDDDKLLPAIAGLLIAIEPGFDGKIEFTSNQIKSFDAVIATGSDNSSRYFQYYFGKYPNIIRKNRNAVAILKGDETTQDMEALADDIFQYYGLGCRNVSKIFVPKGYDFNPLLDVLSAQKTTIENHKYFNNYEYNKAIFLVNSRKHFDTGTVLLVEEEQMASPVSVLNYEYYQDEQYLHRRLVLVTNKIQCILSTSPDSYRGSTLNLNPQPSIIPFGKSQQPELWDYADGVDTIAFLVDLK